MYNIVLIRHGRSRADDEKRCEGRYDSPLTEVGKGQAIKTATALKSLGFQFDTILSSPLLRALETAEIINREYEVTVVTESLLLEHDNGIIAGMLKTELEEKYPLPPFDSPFRYYPQRTGENAIMEHARAGLALNSIIDRGPGSYLVVSHGGILNAIVRNILGIPPIVNGSGIVLNFCDNTYMQLTYFEERHLWRLEKMVSAL
jgi:2,3-bisphosphoglycerate-dependent phosphoglycerate mutase